MAAMAPAEGAVKLAIDDARSECRSYLACPA